MAGNVAPTRDASGREHVVRIMDGFLNTQLLYVAARLGVADALADGPRGGEEVARARGARPDVLYRVLRGLAAEGILDELPDGRFGLTEAGAVR